MPWSGGYGLRVFKKESTSMDNPNIDNVTGISTVTNIPTEPIAPIDIVIPRISTTSKSISSRKNVTNVTNSGKTKTAREKTKNSSTQIDTVEIQRLWRMRWCYFWVGLILSLIWMLTMIAVSLYIFYLTRNFLSLLISTASAIAIEFMRRFANYLLPMDKKRYKLEKKKLELKKHKSSKGKQSN
jgi:beta-lactamase regulating signal transducer with metallopeptidase domain